MPCLLRDMLVWNIVFHRVFLGVAAWPYAQDEIAASIKRIAADVGYASRDGAAG